MPLTVQEKEKISEGFKVAGEEIQEAKMAIQETQEAFDVLAKQLRSITKGFMTGQTETGEKYNRFWATEEEARGFGELILKALNRKALGETIMSEGGIFVPEEYSRRIIDKLGQYGKFRKNAMVVPVGSDRQVVPKVEADLTVYSPGEGKTITESDMDFSQVGLTMHKLACLCKASSELEEDSIIALGEIIGISMARSIAKKEDAIGFVGDGTELYFGMTGIVGALRAVDAVIANIKGLVVASGNAYSEITLADFRKVVGILPEDCDDTAKWYMSKKFYYNVVYPLAETAGVANIFEILSDRKDRFLLGYEVVFVSAMPSVEADSQICAILGDLQLGAFLGERRQLQLARSTDVFFTNDQIGFRGVERIDVNVYGVGDTTEAGPIVGLITAAA